MMKYSFYDAIAFEGCAICKAKGKNEDERLSRIIEQIRSIMEAEWKAEMRDIEAIFASLSETDVKTLGRFEWWDDFMKGVEKRLLHDLEKPFFEAYSYGENESATETAKTMIERSDEAKKAVREQCAEMVQNVSHTTKEDLKRIFSRAFDTGDGVREIAGHIREKFASFSSYRSLLIAQQETAMAYARGKREQFDALSKKYGVTGWKRAKTHTDDRTRTTHRQNALDGWIENDRIFSGTETLDAPFGFNCRCTVVRKLDEPSVEERLRTYYDKVDLPNIGDAEGGNIEKISKNLQKQLPWLTPPEKITWFHNIEEDIMGGFIPTQNTIFLNEKSLKIFGFQEMKETLEHEYGHVIIDFLKNNPDAKVLGIDGKFLHDTIFFRSGKLLLEEDSALQGVLNYPLSFMETQIYNGVKYDDATILKIAQEEVFAESVRYYQNGLKDIFPQYYRDLLEFIFGNREILTKSEGQKLSKRKFRFFECERACMHDPFPDNDVNRALLDKMKQIKKMRSLIQ